MVLQAHNKVAKNVSVLLYTAKKNISFTIVHIFPSAGFHFTLDSSLISLVVLLGKSSCFGTGFPVETLSLNLRPTSAISMSLPSLTVVAAALRFFKKVKTNCRIVATRIAPPAKKKDIA